MRQEGQEEEPERGGANQDRTESLNSTIAPP